MPAGKRTDRISTRDLEVLSFIARFGVVPRSAVATWAATGRSVTIARESRLRREGLIRVARGYGDAGPLALATRAGLHAAGHPELRPARLSAAALSHDALVATLAARRERGGERLLSERQIIAIERAGGEPSLSANLFGGRRHRADLILADADPPTAIEVELSVKGTARLDAILRAWRQAVIERRVSGVTYHCAPRSRRYLERALKRTSTEAVVELRDL